MNNQNKKLIAASILGALFVASVAVAADESIYKTVLGMPDTLQEVLDYRGAYGTAEDCQADIANQTAIFKAATKLNPTVKCEPAVFDNSGFVMRFEAKGEPKKKLYGVDFVNLSKNDAEFNNQVLEIIKANKGTSPQVLSDAYFYYAEERLSVARVSFGYFADSAKCEAQLADAKKILKAGETVGSFVRCFSSPEMAKTVLEAVYGGPTLITSDLGLASKRYSSFEECTADRAGVLKKLADQGYKPLGGICENITGSSYYYQLSVYEGI